MSTSTAVLDHGSTTLHQLDPTLLDLNLLHPTGVQDHLSSVDFTQVDTHFLAQGGLDDLQIEDPESATAGISFDELEDSNAQSIGRKVGFLIILVQLITVIAKGLGSRPGGFAMAYGQGAGIATRLICTAADRRRDYAGHSLGLELHLRSHLRGFQRLLRRLLTDGRATGALADAELRPESVTDADKARRRRCGLPPRISPEGGRTVVRFGGFAGTFRGIREPKMKPRRSSQDERRRRLLYRPAE